ncbi:hypothetical protein [Parasitella parasitica]|uniref:Uncharacterized protein n=1 Tax=Parasitella parasitica TaxID=35722 RepID=A0A0B7MYQ4_9FUNG|nr:hypothetical protein [Parasitella parasitica]
MAIGINVHERDPFKFISYPDSPTMPPTDLPDNIDDHDGNDNNGNNDDSNNSNKDRPKKWRLDDTVILFCKDRLLNLMKEIATDENPLNDNCYSKQFLTAEDQYQPMYSVFPRLKNHCSVNQLQYWIGQAKILGKSGRSRKNQRKPGRNLWVVDEQLRGLEKERLLNQKRRSFDLPRRARDAGRLQSDPVIDLVTRAGLHTLHQDRYNTWL